MNDILKAYKTFKFNKSQGITFISNIVLKKCLNGSTKLVHFLFNKIIELQEISKKLLLVKVIPILKKGKNSHKFQSYRGISVQPNLLRLFETIILNKINPEEQYGYKKSVSIFNQHLDIQNII